MKFASTFALATAATCVIALPHAIPKTHEKQQGLDSFSGLSADLDRFSSDLEHLKKRHSRSSPLAIFDSHIDRLASDLDDVKKRQSASHPVALFDSDIDRLASDLYHLKKRQSAAKPVGAFDSDIDRLVEDLNHLRKQKSSRRHAASTAVDAAGAADQAALDADFFRELSESLF